MTNKQDNDQGFEDNALAVWSQNAPHLLTVNRDDGFLLASDGNVLLLLDNDEELAYREFYAVESATRPTHVAGFLGTDSLTIIQDVAVIERTMETPGEVATLEPVLHWKSGVDYAVFSVEGHANRYYVPRKFLRLFAPTTPLLFTRDYFLITQSPEEASLIVVVSGDGTMGAVATAPVNFAKTLDEWLAFDAPQAPIVKSRRARPAKAAYTPDEDELLVAVEPQDQTVIVEPQEAANSPYSRSGIALITVDTGTKIMHFRCDQQETVSTFIDGVRSQLPGAEITVQTDINPDDVPQEAIAVGT